MSYTFDAPKPGRHWVLIDKIEGTGENFTAVYLHHSPPAIPAGQVMRNLGWLDLHIMHSYTKEDFFENVVVSVAQIVTNDPLVHLSGDIEKMELMYSVYAEK